MMPRARGRPTVVSAESMGGTLGVGVTVVTRDLRH